MKVPDWVDKKMDESIAAAKLKPDPLRMLTVPVLAVKAETDKAYLFIMGDGDYWFPKSQITLDEVKKEITVPAWLKDKATKVGDMHSTPTSTPAPTTIHDSRLIFVQECVKTARQKYPELNNTEWKLFLIGTILEEYNV
jgi:hypothetical protein